MENCNVFKKIADIRNVKYGFNELGKVYYCEPSPVDIQFAIDHGQLEDRGYQTYDNDLMREWKEGLRFEPDEGSSFDAEEESRSLQEFADRCRRYHAKRIAYFVVNGWTDPIILNADGSMKDGLHRFKAAIFKGMDEVDVTISEPDSK
jgi:hypothetical protein